MLSGVLVIRWLQPNEIGLWNSLTVLLSYSLFLQFGIFNGLNRDLPYFLGKGRKEKAIELARTALGVSKYLVISSIILLFIVVLYMLLFTNFEIYLIVSIASIGLMISSQYYNNYLLVTFRTSKAFGSLSKIYFIQSGIIFISLVLVFLFGYYGLVTRALILSIIMVFMTHKFRPLQINPKLNKNNLLLLIKTGFPLFSFSYMQGITHTFSRIILLSISGVTVVGYYAPALAIIATMKSLPSILAQYIYPKMSYMVGEGTKPYKLWHIVLKSTFGLIFLLIPLGIVGWLIMPIVINHFFPKYIEGIFAARLAIISGVFSGSIVGFTVLYSIKAWKHLTFLTIFKLLSYWFLMKYFALKVNPINGVAIGLLISDIIYLIIGILLCYYVLILKNRP